jgi:hypothetical protein
MAGSMVTLVGTPEGKPVIDDLPFHRRVSLVVITESEER